jgi:hypothetical protein
VTAPKEMRYRTYKGFSAALAHFTKAGRVVCWYGTDHHYVIVLREVKS